MSKSRHTEAQMIGALKQLEAGRKAEDVAREVWGLLTKLRMSTKLIVPSTRRESRAKQTPISVFRLVTSINIFGETKALRNIKKPPHGGFLAARF